MSDNIAIKVDHVSKNFRLPHEKVDSVKSLFVNPFRSRAGMKTETQHALKDINLEVKKGEFFGIVGRNGSGKSTLLKIIANIYQPTKGKVTVNGRLVPFIELGVGFNPELSGRENTYLNGALMGFSTDEVDKKYDEIVAFAELEKFMDQKLKNYSSGMQVRLAFSVATVLAESDILLIDEVLAVGDADFQRKCFNYFKNLKKRKKTVIFVSHDMDAVREYCDRAALIDASKVVKVGSSNEVAEQYNRLFTVNNMTEKFVADDTEVNPRWGDGSAKVSNPSYSFANQSLVVDANVLFLEKQDNATIGFVVKDAAGESIFGTNNKVLRQSLDSVRKGDEYAIRWKAPNILSTGKYTVDIAVTKQDGITQADWWSGCLTFDVTNKLSTSHAVSPDIEMAITKK
ncbi:MAG: ABC transporter ATP-binding protein [Candidatus Saccharimonas sp.]|nr:ABC transporter ATP-binding protein [Candidatus Saccharimonas sp.]